MMKIFYDIDSVTKQNLKAALPLVLSRYYNISVSNKTSKFMVCCPFHNESIPSFEIDPQKGVYKCFGCGKGGDVFTLVAEKENLNLKNGKDFQKAAKIIADIANIPLREKSSAKCYGNNTGIGVSTASPVIPRQNDSKESLIPYHIPMHQIEKAMTLVSETGFYKWLVNTFFSVVGIERIKEVLRLYKVGASSFMANGFYAVSFPLINSEGSCIDCKIFHIDPNTGSRKTAPPLISGNESGRKDIQSTFLLAITDDPENPSYKLNKRRDKWAYFGEHLLSIENHNLNCNSLQFIRKVAIVESEKTAVVCALVYPEYIWIATGSMNNLTEERLRPFKNLECVIFPDRDAFRKWSDMAEKLVKSGYCISVDTTVINTVGESHDDMADIIVRAVKKSDNSPDSDKDEDYSDNEFHSDNEISKKTNSDMVPDVVKGSDTSTQDFVPWRLLVPEPENKHSEEWNEWFVNRTAWRVEQKEKCHGCAHAFISDKKEFLRCSRDISLEEAASQPVCRGFKNKNS